MGVVACVVASTGACEVVKISLVLVKCILVVYGATLPLKSQQVFGPTASK
jgi:hypothetical protein